LVTLTVDLYYVRQRNSKFYLKAERWRLELLHNAEYPVSVVMVIEEEHVVLEVVVKGWSQWLKE